MADIKDILLQFGIGALRGAPAFALGGGPGALMSGIGGATGALGELQGQRRQKDALMQFLAQQGIPVGDTIIGGGAMEIPPELGPMLAPAAGQEPTPAFPQGEMVQTPDITRPPTFDELMNRLTEATAGRLGREEQREDRRVDVEEQREENEKIRAVTAWQREQRIRKNFQPPATPQEKMRNEWLERAGIEAIELGVFPQNYIDENGILDQPAFLEDFRKAQIEADRKKDQERKAKDLDKDRSQQEKEAEAAADRQRKLQLDVQYATVLIQSKRDRAMATTGQFGETERNIEIEKIIRQYRPPMTPEEETAFREAVLNALEDTGEGQTEGGGGGHESLFSRFFGDTDITSSLENRMGIQSGFVPEVTQAAPLPPASSDTTQALQKAVDNMPPPVKFAGEDSILAKLPELIEQANAWRAENGLPPMDEEETSIFRRGIIAEMKAKEEQQGNVIMDFLEQIQFKGPTRQGIDRFTRLR